MTVRGHKVLIVIKDAWWSDGKVWSSFAAAGRHRTAVAAKWSTSDTAIMAPDGRVLAFRESVMAQAEVAAMIREAC